MARAKRDSRSATGADARTRKDAAGAKAEKGASGKSKRSSVAKQGAVARFFSEPSVILVPRLLFIASAFALSVFGLVMIYSASSISAYNDFGDPSYYLVRQGIYLAIGVIICLAVIAIPYSIWSRTPAFAAIWGVSVILLAYVAFGGGTSALGAERSITVGSFAFQPGEFAKIAVILTVASLVARYRAGDLDYVLCVAAVFVAILVPVLLIFRQPDLGTVVILCCGLLALGVLAGMRLRWILVGIGVVVAYIVIVCILQPYHLDRVKALIDPWSMATDDGYQTVQSFYALGSGGLFGTGLGLSRQKYLYLPEAHTDFIFAIIGEELGLVGTVFTVLLFAVFVWGGIRICRESPDTFAALLSGSLTVMIGCQALINMGCVAGLLPVTGKALPFLSYGGSSLIATLIACGLVLSVSMRSQVGMAHERRRDELLIIEGNKGRRGGSSQRAHRNGAAEEGASSGGVRKLTVLMGGKAKSHDAGSGARGKQGRDSRRSSDAEEGRRSSRSKGGSSQQGHARFSSGDAPGGRLDYGSQLHSPRTSLTERPKSYDASSRGSRGGGSSSKPANRSGKTRR